MNKKQKSPKLSNKFNLQNIQTEQNNNDETPTNSSRRNSEENSIFNGDNEFSPILVKPPTKYVKWSPENELIMVEWCDIAQCYKWLHTKCHKNLSILHAWFTIPAIALSTISGTASFATASFPDNIQLYVPMVIGSINILIGISTTVQQYLKISELNESHRISAISWDKFARNIRIELAKDPEERMEASHFIKICRAEFDRLMETSPIINDSVIKEFQKSFNGAETKDEKKQSQELQHKRFSELRKPDIFNIIISANESRHQWFKDPKRIQTFNQMKQNEEIKIDLENQILENSIKQNYSRSPRFSNKTLSTKQPSFFEYPTNTFSNLFNPSTTPIQKKLSKQNLFDNERIQPDLENQIFGNSITHRSPNIFNKITSNPSFFEYPINTNNTDLFNQSNPLCVPSILPQHKILKNINNSKENIIIPNSNIEPIIPTLNIEPIIPTLNIEPIIPTLNIETDISTLNIETDISTLNIETDISTLNTETDGEPIVPTSNTETDGEPIVPTSNTETDGEPIVPTSNTETDGEPVVPTSNTDGEPIVPTSNTETDGEPVVPTSNTETDGEPIVPTSNTETTTFNFHEPRL